jgi:hypothetical protein
LIPLWSFAYFFPIFIINHFAVSLLRTEIQMLAPKTRIRKLEGGTLPNASHLLQSLHIASATEFSLLQRTTKALKSPLIKAKKNSDKTFAPEFFPNIL